jgi:hypothetical protein
MSEKPTPIIPPSEWEWFGNAGHFLCGRWCRFHLATKIGPWLVSTVGEYVHPRHSMGSEMKEAKWLKENWPGEDIGYQRKYETMVFLAGAPCACGCGLPQHDGHDHVSRGYNDAASATRGHHDLCQEYAGRPIPVKAEERPVEEETQP